MISKISLKMNQFHGKIFLVLFLRFYYVFLNFSGTLCFDREKKQIFRFHGKNISNFYLEKNSWNYIPIEYFWPSQSIVPLKLDKLLFGGSQIILPLKWLRAVSSSPSWLVATSQDLALRLVSLEKKVDIKNITYIVRKYISMDNWRISK